MPPPPKSRYSIILADKEMPIDWPTYTFRDPDPGFDATLTTCSKHSHGQCGPGGSPYAPAKGLSGKTNRIRPRRISERSLAAAQAVIKQFVVHIDGCLDAEMCFNVLHNERGLSVHFILDNDGILYQTCDLIDCAYHAAGMNESSIGIEINNRGDAKPDPDYYKKKPNLPQRDIVACEVNGHKYVAFDFTPPQYQAMEVLGRWISKYLPGIKLDYPQSSPGVQNWNTLLPQDLTGIQLRSTYTGYLGHYHITERKWDPGPFDFKRILKKVAGKLSFPIGLHGETKPELPESPPVTDRAERAAYDKVFEAYYDNNELEGAGGFFPVGPLDNAQLYHGGIHLHVPFGTPVIAPIVGKVVAARNGPVVNTDIGSTSFVLLHHNVKVGNESLDFYSLYFHLMNEKGDTKADRLKWMAADSWDNAEPNKVMPFDPPEPVQAGDVIGHVGVAGPEGEPQIHWEIFSLDHGPVDRLDTQRFWHVYSGAGDQRFCTNKEILAHVETKKDGIITPEELNDAFRGDVADRLWARAAVTNHYSEWSMEPSWVQELQSSPENKKKPKRQREIMEMYENQILPTLWWTDALAQRIGLPGEARVYTYHPISFMRWLNDLTGGKSVEVTRKATAEDFAQASSHAQLDIDDKDGTSFVNEADLVMVDPKNQLQLPDLIDGYGD